MGMFKLKHLLIVMLSAYPAASFLPISSIGPTYSATPEESISIHPTTIIPNQFMSTASTKSTSTKTETTTSTMKTETTTTTNKQISSSNFHMSSVSAKYSSTQEESNHPS